MRTFRSKSVLLFLALLFVMQMACGAGAPQPTATAVMTDTPMPTATITLTPTHTPRPSPTLRPTRTPNLAATQRTESFNAEAQQYFDKGYLTTASGKITEIPDFEYEWAQLYWYNWQRIGVKVSDFYISAHFKWSSAFRNADQSGCGFLFAVQDNGDHYAVFLDRTRVLVLNAEQTSGYSHEVGLTRGPGKVKFGNPADTPQEADFTIIVKGAYLYALVNNEVVGEYTLSQSRILKGDVALSILSGTNKDYGTRCEMTNIHVWEPAD